MSNYFVKIIFSCCLALMSTVAVGAQHSLKECAAITQSDARLACFDKLADINESNVQKAEDFGEQHLNKSEKPNELDRVVFIVESIGYSANKRLKLTFKNGQRWNQTDSEKISLKTGDKVELFKGVWSAVYLKKVGYNRKIRVKRVK